MATDLPDQLEDVARGDDRRHMPRGLAESRRSVLTPANVSNISEVASLDEDIHEIVWSPERDRMALLGWEKPVVIRNVLSLKPIETIGEGQKLIHFAFSPDKDVVAYCRNGQEGRDPRSADGSRHYA